MTLSTLRRRASETMTKCKTPCATTGEEKQIVLLARHEMTDDLQRYHAYSVAQKQAQSRPYYTQTETLIAKAIERIYKNEGREIIICNLKRAHLTNPAAELSVILCRYVSARLRELMSDGVEYHKIYKIIRHELNSL